MAVFLLQGVVSWEGSASHHSPSHTQHSHGRAHTPGYILWSHCTLSLCHGRQMKEQLFIFSSLQRSDSSYKIKAKKKNNCTQLKSRKHSTYTLLLHHSLFHSGTYLAKLNWPHDTILSDVATLCNLTFRALKWHCAWINFLYRLKYPENDQ